MPEYIIEMSIQMSKWEITLELISTPEALEIKNRLTRMLSILSILPLGPFWPLNDLLIVFSSDFHLPKNLTNWSSVLILWQFWRPSRQLLLMIHSPASRGSPIFLNFLAGSDVQSRRNSSQSTNWESSSIVQIKRSEDSRPKSINSNKLLLIFG